MMLWPFKGSATSTHRYNAKSGLGDSRVCRRCAQLSSGCWRAAHYPVSWRGPSSDVFNNAPKIRGAGTTAVLLAAAIHLAHAQAGRHRSRIDRARRLRPRRENAPRRRLKRHSDPTNPPQARALSKRAAPPLVPNAYESTYKPLPSRTTLIRNATILTASGPVDRARIDPAAERQDRGGRPDGDGACRCARDRCERQVGHAGRDRHALAHRRVCGSGNRIALRTATRRPVRTRRKSLPSIRSGRRIRSLVSRWPAASPRCRSCRVQPTCSAAAA